MPDAPVLDPATTILMLMDLQNGIVPGFDQDGAVMAAAQQALATAREHGAHVGYIRVGLTPEELDAMPAHAPMGAMITPERVPAMHPDAPGTQVDERITPQAGDLVARKPRVGAFSSPEFEPGLRARGITTLVLAGLSTSGVVLSTLRAGADRDYQIVVLADAVGDRDLEVHRVLIEKVFPRQAHVTTVDAFGDLFA